MTSFAKADAFWAGQVGARRATDPPLFLPDRVYEILGEMIVGEPLVITPEEIQTRIQALSNDGPLIEQFCLIGQLRKYEDVPIFDIDRIVSPGATLEGEAVVGMMRVVHYEGASSELVALGSGAEPEQAVVVVPWRAQPVAFVLGPEGKPRQAGLMVRRFVGRDQEEPPEVVRITWNELPDEETEQVARLTGPTEQEVDISVVSRLPFPQPVLCPYRGHRLTSLTELCPDCGVPICWRCLEEAGSCISIKCSHKWKNQSYD
ncbi:hypothetical protein TFLX_04002 [Thermoflexales bacterium]|nr:hypothetical protein TFLX_04002 [Thermoflexales bacterium]